LHKKRLPLEIVLPPQTGNRWHKLAGSEITRQIDHWQGTYLFLLKNFNKVGFGIVWNAGGQDDILLGQVKQLQCT
jgi:hypothetical protein